MTLFKMCVIILEFKNRTFLTLNLQDSYLQINNFILITDNSQLSEDRFTDNNQSPSDVSYPLTCSASDS
jgi:hypothetical protein